ncbi:MAG: ThiF family adenylyltransferase [Agathobacter sp.]|nr:ThiF family adenylyltransferase [Agathobacter sp.]
MDYGINIEDITFDKSKEVLIDIRSNIAYEHGHIPGAVSYPEPFSVGDFAKMVENFSDRKKIIYCSIGEKSNHIVQELNENGIEVYELSGGYRQWLIQEVTKLSCDEKIQYSRQMILPELGEEGQYKLKESKVMVIGAGALGSVALTYLVSAGVGTVGIVENDIIDKSNLHRQILFEASLVGDKKAAVTKEKLEKLNPFVKIETFEVFADADNITKLISGYDFIIDATDNIESKFLINDACVLAHKPFCHAGILGFEGQVMTYVPDDSPCYRCVFEDIPDEYVPNCAQAGVLGAVAGIIGSMQALEAIKYITSIGELLTGRIFHFNGINMQSRIIPIDRKNSKCKVCGDGHEIIDVKKNKQNYIRRNCSLTTM